MKQLWFVILVLGACGTISGCGRETDEDGDSATPFAKDNFSAATCANLESRPVRIEAGSFAMGQEDVYPEEEGPVRETWVDGFWIDPHEVTNAQFRAFVQATGYKTVAELPVDPAQFGVPLKQIPPHLLKPGSAVFTPPSRPSTHYSEWWIFVPGANWRKPYGPDGPEALGAHPVVHLAWEDMVAYAQWAGGRIPTEAEWEFAAKAGEEPYSDQPDGKSANTWQGVFPLANNKDDGFEGIAPVGCFRPNANGLYDMVGNVWEVTQDFYRPGHNPENQSNPRGPSENAAYDPYYPSVAARVIKGGSYLCAPNYCRRYRPAARQGQDPGLGASNVGFRLVYDEAL